MAAALRHWMFGLECLAMTNAVEQVCRHIVAGTVTSIDDMRFCAGKRACEAAASRDSREPWEAGS